MSTGGTEPSGLALALLNLTVQRASRSLWLSLAGLVFQSPGMRPSLIAFFVLGVALLGGGDQRGVDNLPTHRDIAVAAQRRVEPLE